MIRAIGEHGGDRNRVPGQELTFSESLTPRIFERIDTASGDNCNAAFLLALAFAVLGNGDSIESVSVHDRNEGRSP